MDQRACAGVKELWLIPKAPSDRDTIHPSVPGGLEVDL
jgi:hypothetical protein